MFSMILNLWNFLSGVMTDYFFFKISLISLGPSQKLSRNLAASLPKLRANPFHRKIAENIALFFKHVLF